MPDPTEYSESGALSAEIADAGSGVVVSVSGDLDLATAPDLLRRLRELLARPVDALTLDLGELGFMDSSGIAVLNTTRTDAEERGIGFSLVAVPPQAIRVLELTGMTSLFRLNGDDHRDTA